MVDEAPIRVSRPPILDRIDPSKHVVIEASAGTGKTYTLEHLVAEMVIVHEVPLEQILVVTFTDKATREMRERVRATLRRVLEAGPGDEVDSDAPAWLIDEAARQRVSDALAVFDRAPISTIHAFCQRILTENAFDCARLLEQEQVESWPVFERAYREELRVALVPEEPLRPVLELALASLGPERLGGALYHWYAERAPAEPAFSRVQAEEALRGLPDRRDLGPSGMASRVLESALKRNPKKEIPARLRALAPTVERARAGAPFYEVLPEYWAWAEADAPGRKTNIAYVRHYLGRADSAQLRPLADRVEALARAAGSPFAVLIGELLPRVEHRLGARKAAEGHFDFDDMLGMLRDALSGEGGAALVRELRRRYRIALVDEFQDTDDVQWAIFRRIFFEDESAPQRLVVIGDPKQAIYGFRRADVHTYHSAREEIEGRGGAVVPLQVSYRSTAPFLDALNRVLAEGFFTGVNAYPHPVSCGRPERAAIDVDGEDVAPFTLLHCVGRPELRAAWVTRALCERIATQIRAIIDGSLRVDHGEGPIPVEPSDIHVLCRSRGDAQKVGEALAEARVPFAFYKKEGLFQTEAARHIWEILRALEAPDDRVRRLHAWLTPFFAVPLARLADCRDLPPDHLLLARLREWRELAISQRWATLFRAMLEGSGLVRRELFLAQGERDLTDYQHVLEILLEETHGGRRTLPQLVARLAAFIDGRELPSAESGNVQRLESERKSVQILTMHKSKGLEAEVVFLIGGLSEVWDDSLSPRVFHDTQGRRIAWLGDLTPDARARLDRERREEAERLLYVAITRARSKLFVPYFGPPPPGATARSDVSFELPEIEPELPEEGQLRLFLEDPELGEPEVSPEYQLRRMSGPYRVLNDRLAALVAEGVTSGPLFEREEVEVGPGRAPAVAHDALALSGWRPARDLRLGGPVDPRYAAARERHAGFEITSYTRMKRAVGGYRAPDDLDEALTGSEEPDVALPPVAEELPGGSAVGVFLHEVLEHIDPERVLAGGDLLADPESKRLFERHATANGVDHAHLAAAAELVQRALRTPLRLADGAILTDGLGAVEHRATELPFVHPIPERSHPALGSAPQTPDAPSLRIERGYVRGVIDLVIEHEGRFHVLDYKSDRLPSYVPDDLATHVGRNYVVQARLYTLGALRALSIHGEDDYEARFGGLLYLFLRGVDEGGAGVHVERATWDEVVAWERELLRDEPWGYPLPRRRASSG